MDIHSGSIDKKIAPGAIEESKIKKCDKIRSYEYDISTHEGTWDDIQIHVDLSYSSGKKFGMHVQHPNYLQMLFVNELEKHVVHRRFEKLFKEHVRPGSFVYQMLPVKNHRERLSWIIVPDELKSIIRGLISFVSDIHLKRKFLSDFNEENLVVIGTTVMFWKVEFFDFTFDGGAKDMKCLHTIIRNLFRGAPMPMDVEDLLKKLIVDFPRKEENWRNREFYLRNHLSILTMKERNVFMRNIRDRIPFLPSYLARNHLKAMKAFAMKVDHGWRKEFEESKLGPIKVCFHYEQGSEKTPYHGGDITNPPIIKCIRNMATHLSHAIKSFHSSSIPHDHNMDLEVDASIMYVFAKDILNVQWYFHTEFVLEEFLV